MNNINRYGRCCPYRGGYPFRGYRRRKMYRRFPSRFRRRRFFFY